MSGYEITLPVVNEALVRKEHFDFGSMDANEIEKVFRGIHLLHKDALRCYHADTIHFSETPCDAPPAVWAAADVLCVTINRKHKVSLAWHKPYKGECAKYREEIEPV
jgi:hypothetical protein